MLRENEIHSTSRDTRQQSGTLSGNYKVTNDTKVKYDLDVTHTNYAVTNTDKASNKIIIICQKYSECMLNK